MPDENEIANLLATLRDISQPEEARHKALEQLLAHEEEVKSHLRKDFRASMPASGAMLSEAGDAYDRLSRQLNFAEQVPVPVQKAPPRIFPYRRWASIAAVFVLCVCAAWFFRYQGIKPTIATVRYTPGAFATNNKFDTIRNVGSSTSFHRLQDGSTVHLEASSQLFFRDSFSATKKEIFLEGSALFAVHKEARRPFSVFVSGIEVVDLGTVFSITTKQSLVKVRLIQGKVLIHPVNAQLNMQDIRLVPGQEFRIDTITHRYSVNLISPEGILRNSKLSKALSFKNTPLQEVFERIGKECGVSINFNKTEIKDMAFTGTFDAGSNTRDNIATICMINDLEYELTSNSIHIHSKAFR